MRVSIFEERDSLGSENLTVNEFADNSLEVISDKLASSSYCVFFYFDKAGGSFHQGNEPIQLR